MYEGRELEEVVRVTRAMAVWGVGKIIYTSRAPMVCSALWGSPSRGPAPHRAPLGLPPWL